MNDELLLRRTRVRLVDRYGFTPLDSLKDRGGKHCSIMRGNGSELFFVVAKEQVWDGKASLLMKTVVIAESKQEAKIVVWFKDLDEHHVFDPGYVLENGRMKRAESKSHETHWLVIPMHHSVTLDDYLKHRDTPSTRETTYDASLRRYQ